jgi:hypothetical protein
VELERVILHYQIGTIIDQVDADSIAQSITYLKENPEILATQKMNCLKASASENWEIEKQKLHSFIQIVLGE